MLFADRWAAGRVLAAKLSEYADRPDVVVLGLPRGGVIVAAEIAKVLRAPLDVFVVRKLGVPGHEELAMGAIASGGVSVLNEEVIRQVGIGRLDIEDVSATELQELERRERAYREGRPPLDLTGKTAIVVDDGLATGASMRAAVEALRSKRPARIVVAVPVAAADSCREIGRSVDRIVCGERPAFFMGVGQWYDDFSQTTDDEVRAALREIRAGTGTGERQRMSAGPAPGRRIQPRDDEAAMDAILREAKRLRGEAGDYDELLEHIDGARLVLIGEASHGTHEFYRQRAILTRRLISEKGFTAVAAEADWPDAYRVNRYVRGSSSDVDTVDALGDFARFPAWMWRNADVLDFVGWLREHNDAQQGSERKVGFYGLDLYSLFSSIQAVLAYLDKVDPEGAGRARQRYACFDHFGADAQSYGLSAGFDLERSCEDEVVAQLTEMRRHAVEFSSAAPIADDERFFAEQNARVVKNAEEYYRTMFKGRVSSWNLRDQHMMETLEGLLSHLQDRDRRAKVVVWAHNSHLGDARATDMGDAGELNLGQLVRQRHGLEAASIGFTTYQGTVTAASEWGGAAERKRVRPALPRSYEALFHAAGRGNFLLTLRPGAEAVDRLRQRRLQRAIGVIYLPRTERMSHYFEASLPDQFDAVIHIDDTRAVEPLERTVGWQRGEVPETFPSAV